MCAYNIASTGRAGEQVVISDAVETCGQRELRRNIGAGLSFRMRAMLMPMKRPQRRNFPPNDPRDGGRSGRRGNSTVLD